MTESSVQKPGVPEALQRQIEISEDAVDLSKWYPARNGIVPEFRLGTRWFSVLWLLLVGFAGAALVVAISREIYDLPVIQQFIARYPGYVVYPLAYTGFPLWLRLQHAFNLFMMMFIIRSGLARWWHFSCDLLWLLNGLIFYIFLFTTGQWMRLVPISWEVLPNALADAIQYASFHMPPENGWVRYNSLQQLAYFTTVFIAAPLATFSGIMQSPAVSNRTGWLGKTFNRQVARTVHFAVLLYFLQFIVVHVTMVLITGALRNLNHITLGTDTRVLTGTVIMSSMVLLLAALWQWATPFTIKNARLVQRVGKALTDPIMKPMELWDPRTEYGEKDIAPFLWPNGKPPGSAEFKALCDNDFADYKLRVCGLVANPTDFTYDELKAMPKQEQVTNHFCIQGWSGVARWGGVRVEAIMDKVRPLPQAKYVIVYSFQEGQDGGFYWDAHTIENMRHKLSILAYEMNGKPLPVLNGAPLRLRCENELGFKLVKWISALEFVEDFKHIGSGQGGYAEDHEFFGYSDPI
jgi:DMSO/TMAO reductase YedYZ molybdopterin-dependent catalytic subunit/thiosulfate reductase cytochrome b subunit